MEIFVNTRSIEKDYRYLGKSPDNAWLSKYSQAASFEHPTIIIERETDSYRLFLGGMPCTRQDKVNTSISYSFLITSAIDESNPALINLIALWTEAIHDDEKKAQLAEKLGELFTEEQVNDYISHSQESHFAEIQQKVADWLEELPKPTINSLTFDVKQTQTIKENPSQNFINYCHSLITQKVAQQHYGFCLDTIKNQTDLQKSKLNETLNHFAILLNNNELHVHYQPELPVQPTIDIETLDITKKPLAIATPMDDQPQQEQEKLSPQTKILIVAGVLVVVVAVTVFVIKEMQ